MKIKLVHFIIPLFILVSCLNAHGLHLKLEKKPSCINIFSSYDGNMPVASGKVTIYYNNNRTIFQTGRTDKNGGFSFIPDKEGTWYFAIDDEMGHTKKLKIPLGHDFFKNRGEKKENRQHNPTPYYLKLFLGAFLILLLTFIIYFWKKRKEKMKDQ